MPWLDVLWVDGPGGNVEHIAEHGLTTAEIDTVLRQPIAHDISTSSGRPIAFGYSAAGKRIAVVYEEIDETTVYPITAYEVER